MAVMMQAFYWDAPILEKQEGNWWNLIAERVEALSKSRFNALWLPALFAFIGSIIGFVIGFFTTARTTRY